MPALLALVAPMADVPLDPSAGEARRLLEVELSKPEYQQQQSLFARFLRWLETILPGLDAGAAMPVGLVVVLGLLLLGLAALVWRLRDIREVAAERRTRSGGLTDPARTAESYREEARARLAEGATDRACVAAFRAVVVDLDERGTVHDAPGRTAHEVASVAAAALPDQGAELHWAASCFDRACYGHPDGPLPGPGDPQRTSAADAERLLALGRPVVAR